MDLYFVGLPRQRTRNGLTVDNKEGYCGYICRHSDSTVFGRFREVGTHP